MKYYNKGIKFRKTWVKIVGPDVRLCEAAKRWCQQSPSKSRFFFKEDVTLFWAASFEAGRDLFTTWEFEDPQDALAFSLVWARKRSL